MSVKVIRVTGFTLIEVLLAMSIFAIAGLAILSTSDTHFNHLGQIEKKMVADWVASDRLVEAKLAKTWPPKNNQKGKVEIDGQEWFWLQKVIKTTDNNMRAIVIEVRLDDKEKLALTSLMTYVSKEDTQS